METDTIGEEVAMLVERDPKALVRGYDEAAYNGRDPSALDSYLRRASRRQARAA